MGRAGVTLLDVEKAALQLQGRGKNPSVDAVREILGTGSKSTIAQHLRSWKAQEHQAQGKLPQALLALVTGLWERLNLQVDQRIEEIETVSQQQMQELKQALTRIQQDHIYLQKQLHQSEEIQAAERAAKEKVEKKLYTEQQEHAKLLERYQVTLQQLEGSKEENARLHQLANNIQANLEHYQQAIQQLRTEQALAIEKQQAQSQQEMVNLKKDLALKQTQCKKLEDQLAHKILEFNQLEKQHGLLQESQNKLAQLNHEQSSTLAILHERCAQYQKITAAHEQELTNKRAYLVEMEKQTAVLTDKMSLLQQGLSTAEDKIELLRQEKLFLVQEKSELQGHLKQLERGEK